MDDATEKLGVVYVVVHADPDVAANGLDVVVSARRQAALRKALPVRIVATHHCFFPKSNRSSEHTSFHDLCNRPSNTLDLDPLPYPKKPIVASSKSDPSL